MTRNKFRFSKPASYAIAAIFSAFIWTGSLFAQADFLSFNFDLNPSYQETINVSSQTVEVEVYNSADVTALRAIFTASNNAIVKIGTVTQVSGQTVNDFSSDVVYTITSGDGSVTKNWTVSIVRREASVEKQLISFSFASLGATATINEVDHTVYITVPYSQDVTALVATFQISPLAILRIGEKLLVSGVTVHDYTNALEENGDTITLTIEAENGSTRNYYISVRRAAAETGKSITYFAFEDLDPDAVGVIDQANETITLTVPYEIPVTSLVASFNHSNRSTVKVGNTNQVSGVTPNNFTNPITYTVVAEDGSTKDYVVTVNKAAASTEKSILTFRFADLDPEVAAAIDQTNYEITATVPYAVDVTSLVAFFTVSEFATVTVEGVNQLSGQTANDFTGHVDYTVTAQDGSTRNYTVIISKAAASQENEMLTFKFEAALNNALTVDVVGNIDPATKQITLDVPYATDVTQLIATFTHSPLSSVTVNGVNQESRMTAQNFTNAVDYQVTAEDGSSEIYTVTVNQLPASQENSLISFQFLASLNATLASDMVAAIDQTAKTAIVHVPYGTDVTALIASFVISDFATAKVGTVTQTSGETPNDFTNVVTYAVYAQDLSVELYSVTVIKDPNTENRLLSFSFQGIDPPTSGTIDENLKTVTVNIPHNVARYDLIATFEISDNATAQVGSTVQVSGSTSNSFTNPVVYTIIAQNGTTQDYQVTVNNLPIQSGKQITEFKFSGLDPEVVATIDQTNLTITANVPYGTDLTDLVATFTNSYLSTVTVGGTEQVSGVTANDFSSDLSYLVTAEDNSNQSYTVSINEENPNTEKDLLYFAFEDFDPVITGVISEAQQTVTCVVPYGTPRNSMVASFTVSEHAQVKVAGQGYQQSGITEIDFTDPVVYEIYAQDDSMKDYLVIVNEEPDVTAPIVSLEEQAVSNKLGQFVILRSNENTGKVYIIHADATQDTPADLEAAIAAGQAKSAFVQSANADVPVATYALPEGIYYAYAVDASGNMSARGTNIVTIIDELAPVVYINFETVSNAPNTYVMAQSSEAGSFIYLIKEGVPQSTIAELNAAVSSLNGAKAYAGSAYRNTPLLVERLNAGNYHAYASDVNDNLSDASTQYIVIVAASRQKEFTSYSFENTSPSSTGTISGNQISVEVPHGTDLTSLVATFTLSEKAKAYIGLVEQVSGLTPNNFTLPVEYTVEADDGSQKKFTVTVTEDDGTGITDWDINQHYKLYPNPCSSYFTIETQHVVDQLIISDLNGRVVKRIENPVSSVQRINVNDWKSGVYLVRIIQDNNLVYYQKIIKQ